LAGVIESLTVQHQKGKDDPEIRERLQGRLHFVDAINPKEIDPSKSKVVREQNKARKIPKNPQRFT
jgi:hypothetical protein